MAGIRLHKDGLERWSRGEGLEDPEVVAGFASPADGSPAAPDDEGAEFRVSKLAGVHFRAGDVVVFQGPGAGGYGDARERDPEAVRRDVRNEIVSAEEAERLYGADLG
jgi:N-methylhydantoinase B